VTRFPDIGLSEGTPYYYRVAATDAAGTSVFSNVAGAQTPYATPTVATAAAAGQTTVTGTTDTLSVLGAIPDGGNESALTYTWSVISGPGGAAFSADGTNAAKNTTVTFTAAGTYTLQATIHNGPYSATSSVQVTVGQTPMEIKVAPPASDVLSGGSEQFTATAADQFGQAMDATFDWSVGDPTLGTIGNSGLFTASMSEGITTVQASAGGVAATASVRISGSAAVEEPPTNVTASGNGSTSIVVSWTPAADPDETYNIYLSTEAGFTPSSDTLIASNLPASPPQYTINGLDPSATYYVVVTGSVAGSSPTPGVPANGGDPTTIGAAPSDGSGGSQPQEFGVASSGSVAPNDDLSGSLINLGFNINFYGKTYTQAYVNNNGNITFISPLSQYTPQAITGLGYPMIAPFWADVDTRTQVNPQTGDSGCGTVTFFGTTVNDRPAFEADWTGVGYFNLHSNLQNTFSVQIVNRDDVNIGDFDIIFNYGSITWETGDASRGHNGMGGTPAYAGWTNGDGQQGDSYQLDGSGQSGGLIGMSGQRLYEIRNLDLSIDSDNNNGTDLPDHSYDEETLQDAPDADGKDVVVDDGTQAFTDFVPVDLSAPNDAQDVSSAQFVFNYSDAGVGGTDGGCFRLYAPNGTYIPSGQAVYGSDLQLSSGSRVTMRLEAVVPADQGQSHEISVHMLADPIQAADTVKANATAVSVTFSKKEVRPGTAAAHVESVDVTVTRTSAANADTIALSVVNKGGANDGSASIDTQTISLAAGEKKKSVTIKISGQHLSGANQDVTVQASEGGQVRASLPATVVQPKKFNSSADGKTLTGKAAIVAGSPTQVNWRVDVVFTVDDQFRTPLDGAWAGIGLAEHVLNNPQGFTGFTPGSASTAIDATGQATDPVQNTKTYPDADTANAVVAGTVPRPVLKGTFTLEYKVIDTDGTEYTLDGNNVRSVRIQDNRITDADAVQ
jgi:hypothetical protein